MNTRSGRPKLGVGQLETPRCLSVFINCPYDEQFVPIFDAIVFTTICCGFMPRCAIELDSSAIPRMERITRTLSSSKYSIHDLSRSKGEGASNHARFNMPLELGMAMAERSRTDLQSSDRHDWLLLMPNGHAYQTFISDLGGIDPKFYDSTKDSAVTAVMSWLVTRDDALSGPDSPHELLDALPAYETAVTGLRTRWGRNLPWTHLIMTALRTADGAGLIPSRKSA